MRKDENFAKKEKEIIKMVEIKFIQHWQMFNAGEIASFSKKEADTLVDKGYATFNLKK
jgi:hypothetical protein